jgi:serine/threonine-protein kinase ATR
LTQNIIDGFGITGYEGSFRRSCEITLGILRNNQETLMNVLHTFIHDPLLEWKDKESTPSRSMTNIECRLKGQITKETLALSVQGQVHHLIKIASSEKYLSQM